MRRKKDVLKFLEDNSIMINGLMSKEESRKFGWDVVKIITDDIKKQMNQESRDIE